MFTQSMLGPGVNAGLTTPHPPAAARSLPNLCTEARFQLHAAGLFDKASCSWPETGYLMRRSQTRHVMACAGRVAYSWRAPQSSCATAQSAVAVLWRTAHWCVHVHCELQLTPCSPTPKLAPRSLCALQTLYAASALADRGVRDRAQLPGWARRARARRIPAGRRGGGRARACAGRAAGQRRPRWRRCGCPARRHAQLQRAPAGHSLDDAAWWWTRVEDCASCSWCV